MVFPTNDYSNDALTMTDGKYVFTHKAFGAERFRYSGDYALSWSDWQNWEDSTTIEPSFFKHEKSDIWEGVHIIVQCELSLYPLALSLMSEI
jgi:alpha-1,3-glucan synthase